MDELVRWLGEQLDEDERVLRAGLDAAVPPSGHVMQDRVLFGGLDRGVPEPIMDAYVRFGDPARVLREIDAKRGIVRAYEAAVAAFNDSGPAMANYERLTGSVSSLRGSIELLATAYSDRPGFREEWRP